MSQIFQPLFKSLKLYNFRNHKVIKLEDVAFDTVIITGSNGVGKTNILEAVSLLTSSKGLRGAKIQELNNCNHPEYLWKIEAEVKTAYGLKEVVTHRYLKENSKTESRLVYIDGLPIKKKIELSNLFKVIWVTPPMQQLFTGSASDRRVFFDKIVNDFFPDHSVNLSRYEKITRERLKLLKDNFNDGHWISALEQNMFNEGGKVSDARMKTLALLSKAINQNDTPFPKAILSLINEPIPADFLLRLKHNRNLDASTGRTNLGPHLFDLDVIFKDKNMPAKFCSTGEQKALLMNLILAQAYALIEEFKSIPIMLFDEIISHLDSINRGLLFDELIKLGSQNWLTGVDPKSFTQIKQNATNIQL